MRHTHPFGPSEQLQAAPREPPGTELVQPEPAELRQAARSSSAAAGSPVGTPASEP